MRIIATIAFAMALCFALFLGGCKDEPACVTQEHCPPEAACIDGDCVERVCYGNADCPMGEHCALETGQCKIGCTEDGDCYFGEQCQGGSCQEKPCTSTAQDCAAGQYCDVFTGSCFDAPDVYCADCKSDADCGCTTEDCTGNQNNICRYVSGEGPFCLPQCGPDYDCPAGYDCISLRTNGEITGWYCVTLCHQLEAAEGVMMSQDPELSPFKGVLP